MLTCQFVHLLLGGVEDLYSKGMDRPFLGSLARMKGSGGGAKGKGEHWTA